MNNKNRVAMVVILGALVITLGSVVVAKRIARGGNEEASTADMIDKEHRIDDVTIDGDKLVYKDNSVGYVKYVILDYVVDTNYYVEDTYYWFNTEEEYQSHLRELSGSVIDYNSETLMVRTMSDVKERPWNQNLNELKGTNGIKIIR